MVRLDGPAIASQELRILTRPGEIIKVLEIEDNPDYGFPRVDAVYYGAAFKHPAAPTKPIVGVVRDKDTKKPLAGVTVKSDKLGNHPVHGIDFIQTKTDEQGRYRLTGMPKGVGSKIVLVPRDDQPYLKVHADVPDTPSFDPVTVDFDLKRGVWVEGKITDKVTGKPLQARVQYLALVDNPNLRHHPRFDGTFQPPQDVHEDGTYRVVGLPGPGLVVVEHGTQYLLSSERDDAEGSKEPFVYAVPFHVFAMNNNALARIDPALDAERVTRDVTLDPGETFRGTLVGPDGKPLAGAMSSGLTASAGWERPALETAEFTVRAFNPRRPRPVLFRHVEKGLAGVLEAPKDASQPVTVRLEPGATATGRLVDADGRARANVELDISIRVRGDSWDGYSLPQKIKTDAAGRFSVGTLLPGYQYEFYDRQGSFHFGNGLRPGETKELGDVQLKGRGD